MFPSEIESAEDRLSTRMRSRGDQRDMSCDDVTAVPRTRDSHDDMSYDAVTAVPQDRDSDDHMSSALDEIEARIEQIEAELALAIAVRRRTIAP